MPKQNLADDEQLLRAAIRRAFAPYVAPPRDISVSAVSAPPRRPKLVAMSVVAVPIAALVVVVAIVLRSLVIPSSVFASWTPVPTAPDPVLAAQAADDCRGVLVPPPEEMFSEEEWQRLEEPFRSVPTLPLVAQDQRGRVALVLFSDGRAFVSCIVLDEEERGQGGMAVGMQLIETPRTTTLRLLGAGALRPEEEVGRPQVSVVMGDVAPEVASVVIVRDDGVEVTATVSNGYFLAWWPTSDDAATFAALDANGNTLDVIPNTMRGGH